MGACDVVTCHLYRLSKGKGGSKSITMPHPESCGDECVSKYTDMKKRDKEAEQFGDQLIKEGHRCVIEMESYPRQIGWCRKPANECTGNK